jgi:hypothetical protein
MSPKICGFAFRKLKKSLFTTSEDMFFMIVHKLKRRTIVSDPTLKQRFAVQPAPDSKHQNQPSYEQLGNNFDTN